MADQPTTSDPRKLNQALARGLSAFHGIWSLIDMTADYGIFKFLDVTPEQTHLITGGMLFGRKARLLVDLVGRSDHPKRSEILGALNWIRGHAMRDIITHGYQRFDDTSIGFVDRSTGGEFRATETVFSNDEFIRHVRTLSKNCRVLQSGLNATQDDLREFANAAFNLNRKSKRSPQAPATKA